MVSYYILDATDTKISLSANSDIRAAITEAFNLEATCGAISLFCSVDDSPARYALTIDHTDPRNATNSRGAYLAALLVAYCPPVSLPQVTATDEAYMSACIKAVDSSTGRRC